MVKVFVILNNVSSPQRLMDTAKVVFSVKGGIKPAGFVVCRASGMAAQTGVPEVARLAYKLGESFLILPSLNDAIEVINPTKVLLLVNEGGRELKEVIKELSKDDVVALVVSGSDNGFSKGELGLGQLVSISYFRTLPPAPAVATALYIIASELRSTSEVTSKT